MAPEAQTRCLSYPRWPALLPRGAAAFATLTPFIIFLMLLGFCLLLLGCQDRDGGPWPWAIPAFCKEEATGRWARERPELGPPWPEETQRSGGRPLPVAPGGPSVS